MVRNTAELLGEYVFGPTVQLTLILQLHSEADSALAQAAHT